MLSRDGHTFPLYICLLGHFALVQYFPSDFKSLAYVQACTILFVESLMLCTKPHPLTNILHVKTF